MNPMVPSAATRLSIKLDLIYHKKVFFSEFRWATPYEGKLWAVFLWVQVMIHVYLSLCFIVISQLIEIVLFFVRYLFWWICIDASFTSMFTFTRWLLSDRHQCWLLQWLHNECNGISNHQPYGCLHNHLFRHRSKKTSKHARHWPLWGEFTSDRWIPHTKGQQCGKCFHLMMSSCVNRLQ